MEPDFKRAKHAKLAEVRVALRAAERASWIGNIYEVKYLQEQVDAIHRDALVDTHAEVDLIIQQLNQRAANDRRKAADAANKTEAFTCCVCMDRSPLSELRLLMPCGHGFCEPCMRAVHVQPLCPTCRKTINNVIRPYI